VMDGKPSSLSPTGGFDSAVTMVLRFDWMSMGYFAPSHWSMVVFCAKGCRAGCKHEKCEISHFCPARFELFHVEQSGRTPLMDGTIGGVTPRGVRTEGISFAGGG
jgi:hypothetical protein